MLVSPTPAQADGVHQLQSISDVTSAVDGRFMLHVQGADWDENKPAVQNIMVRFSKVTKRRGGDLDHLFMCEDEYCVNPSVRFTCDEHVCTSPGWLAKPNAAELEGVGDEACCNKVGFCGANMDGANLG